MPALVGRLEDESPAVVEAACMALGTRGRGAAAAVGALAKLLDETPHRPAVAGALGRIGPAAVPHLMRRLDRDDAELRLRVVGALSLVGVDGPDAVRLEGLFDDENPRVRVLAACAVWRGTRQLSDGVKAVLSAALDSDELTVRRMALSTLTVIGPPAREFTARVSEMLGDKNYDVRRDAAAALRRIAPEPATKVPDSIRELLRHEEVATRLQGLRALDRFGAAAAPLLEEALRDEHPLVRSLAAYDLLHLRPRPASAADTVRPLLKDPDAKVRASGAQVLWIIERKPGPLVPVLVGIFEEDAEEFATYRALATLQGIGPRAADAATVIRRNMPKAKGNLAVHYAAALWAITRDAKAVLPVFEQAMQDPDRFVRQRALHELARLGGAAKPLRGAVLRALREEADGGNRLAAVLVLEELGPGDEVFAALKQAAADKDPVVRAAAERALEMLSPSKGGAAKQPAAKQPADDAAASSRGAATGGPTVFLRPATYFGGDGGRLTVWGDGDAAGQPGRSLPFVVHSPHAGIEVAPARPGGPKTPVLEFAVSVAEDTEPGLYALRVWAAGGEEARILLTVADVFMGPEERLDFDRRWVPVADDEVTWTHDRLRYRVQTVPEPLVAPALVEWLVKPSAGRLDPAVPWRVFTVGVGGEPAEVGPQREPGINTFRFSLTMMADSFTGSR